MAGLVKAKEYDWKDSNVALIGSDLDRSVKKEAAKTEPAWKSAGEAVGLKIWRITTETATSSSIPTRSQIVLLYDLHFWIGKHSTQVYSTLLFSLIPYPEINRYLLKSTEAN